MIVLLLKLMKEIMKIMTQDEKEREIFEKHNFEIFQCNPSVPNFDLFKFIGKINLYISKLCKKKVNEVLNKIAQDFETIVAVTKLKELKQYAKNILPNYKE